MTQEKIDVMFENGVIQEADGILYSLVFEELEKTESVERLLELMAEKMELIIYKGYRFDMLFSYLNRYWQQIDALEEKNRRIINKIDKAIADNFEIFISKQQAWGYDYSFFDNLPLTKERIKARGLSIILKLPFMNGMKMEERIKVCEEYFGEYNSKDYGVIKFCNLGETKATIIGTIIEELRQQSEGEVSSESIKKIGEGMSAEVYLVGDYVLKIGSMRKNDYKKSDILRDVIPNSRYIAQPIIRQVIDREIPGYENRYVRPMGLTIEEYKRIYGEEEADKQIKAEIGYLEKDKWDVNYIEVQNKMDMNWWQGMTKDEIEEICDSVVENLLREGIWAWDTGKKNIAKTIKPNKTNFYFEDIELNEDGSIKRRVKREIKPMQEGIRMLGEIKEGDYLGVGEYVLVDTEYAQYIGDKPTLLEEKLQEIQRRRVEREKRKKQEKGR